jgi:hypothetical protein
VFIINDFEGKDLMYEKYLTQEQLAARWHMSSSTLSHWRWSNKGPRCTKLNGIILYELDEVEKFEEQQRSQQPPKNKTKRKVTKN